MVVSLCDIPLSIRRVIKRGVNISNIASINFIVIDKNVLNLYPLKYFIDIL